MTDRTLNGTDLLRVLLDEERLQVLGLLSLAPRSVTELAEATGMGTGDVRVLACVAVYGRVKEV